MIIRFTCENGHRLKADSKYEGRKTSCPKCQSVVAIPKQTHDVTDSSVMRFIDGSGQFTLQPSNAKPIAGSASDRDHDKQCPRCQTVVPASTRVCTCCSLYLMTTATTWTSALTQAKRYVRENRRRSN